MTWLIVSLVLIIVILLIFIFSYKKDIRYITKQIMRSKGQFTNIKMYTLYNDIEKLTSCINELYEINNNSNLRLEKSDEQLKNNIANISHDLRTPLTSIMGYIQLIKDENTTQEERQKYLEIIERRADSLHDLITSFYELSIIDCRENKFELKALNLSSILCSNIASFYNDFINKNIEPIIDIDNNTPYIIADENVVNRVFSNLINNMLKHGEDKVIITLRKEKDGILTEFANAAPSLKQEDMEHIFDRFYTADSTRGGNNTGLGLYIVKTLVEQSGNKVQALLSDKMLYIRIKWSSGYKE